MRIVVVPSKELEVQLLHDLPDHDVEKLDVAIIGWSQRSNHSNCNSDLFGVLLISTKVLKSHPYGILISGKCYLSL